MKAKGDEYLFFFSPTGVTEHLSRTCQGPVNMGPFGNTTHHYFFSKKAQKKERYTGSKHGYKTTRRWHQLHNSENFFLKKMSSTVYTTMTLKIFLPPSSPSSTLLCKIKPHKKKTHHFYFIFFYRAHFSVSSTSFPCRLLCSRCWLSGGYRTNRFPLPLFFLFCW